jgi:RNA polymerase sigma-70 factor (ECF subfamily)
MRHPPRDQLWLEHLFDEHATRLRAFAARRVGANNADDIVAEVFTTVWRRRSQVPDPALPWLYQTARHAILHHYRSEARRGTLSVSVLAALPPRAAPSAEDQSRSLVDDILSRLDDTDAEVLQLTIWEQLTPTEIAIVLAISPGAARNRLLRARQRAQQLYQAASNPTPITRHRTDVEPCPTNS